jgi:D-glycero-D-manno-heptose 1,7-bisphosphate phosphatase
VRPAIFLDRDGTIIVDKNYMFDPNEVELIEGTLEGLRLLKDQGYLLIVVTNQSGVGRGIFTVSDVEKCHLRVDEILANGGVSIDAWLYCPHSPDDTCDCRKPATGLIDQARSIFQINIPESIMLGDKDSDLLLAENAGFRGLLVRTGSGRSYEDWAIAHGFECFDNLLEAAKSIGSR